MKIIFLLFVFILAQEPILCTNLSKILADKYLTAFDSVDQNKYSNMNSIWGLRLGYFPIAGNGLETSGFSATIFNEYRFSKIFNFGWSLLVNQAINNNGGYLFLGAILSHPLRIEKQVFYLRSGLGLGVVSGLARVVFFEVEYLIWEFEESAISISISECIPEFNKLMPPVISIGILF